MRNTILILIIVAVIGTLFYFYWYKPKEKQRIAEAIMAKYGDKTSKDYQPGFDAEMVGLMKTDIRDLKGLLANPNYKIQYTKITA